MHLLACQRMRWQFLFVHIYIASKSARWETLIGRLQTLQRFSGFCLIQKCHSMKLKNLLFSSFTSSYFNVFCILMCSIIKLHFQWPIHLILVCISFLRQGRHYFFSSVSAKAGKRSIWWWILYIKVHEKIIRNKTNKRCVTYINPLVYNFSYFYFSYKFYFPSPTLPSPFLKIGKFILKDVCEYSLFFTAQAKSPWHPSAEFLQSTDSTDQKMF